jgi:hypothetical protein
MSLALKPPRQAPAAIARVANRSRWILFFRTALGLLVLKIVIQSVVNFAVFYLEEKAMPDARLFVALRQEGFQLAQRAVERPALALEDPAPPVLLLDISRLMRVDFYGNRGDAFAPKIDYTPRAELTKLLAVLEAKLHPAAIGIDVDFSPDYTAHGGRTPQGQEELLEFCLERASPPENGLSPRIFLGVGRGSGSPDPKDWLGSPDYAAFAASAVLLTDEIGVTPPIYSLVPSSIEFRSRTSHASLPSLSTALVEAYRQRHPTEPIGGPPAWLQRFADKTIAVDQPFVGEFERHIAAYQINYAQVDLLHGQRVDAALLLEPGAELQADLEERFRDRIVLMGSADFRRAPDKIVVPGKRDLVPGIYAHASGVLTQLRSPLWRLKKHASVLLSIIISVICGTLAILAARRWPVLGKGPREELIGLLLAFLLILLVASTLARWGSVLWIGSIGTAVGSCIEIFVVLFFLGHLQPSAKPTAPAQLSSAP